MGEAANVQQLQPEVVIGYVVIMDEAEDRTRKDGKTWSDHFENNLRKIAIRKAPLWNQGLIEGIWLFGLIAASPSAVELETPLIWTPKAQAFSRRF